MTLGLSEAMGRQERSREGERGLGEGKGEAGPWEPILLTKNGVSMFLVTKKPGGSWNEEEI